MNYGSSRQLKILRARTQTYTTSVRRVAQIDKQRASAPFVRRRAGAPSRAVLRQMSAQKSLISYRQAAAERKSRARKLQECVRVIMSSHLITDSSKLSAAGWPLARAGELASWRAGRREREREREREAMERRGASQWRAVEPLAQIRTTSQRLSLRPQSS